MKRFIHLLFLHSGRDSYNTGKQLPFETPPEILAEWLADMESVS
jgi:hypothetical protein